MKNGFGHNPGKQARPLTKTKCEEAAGQWLARRDRGLTGEEKVEFDAWLAADPRNGPLLWELELSFHALDRAAGLRPQAASQPDPDFLVATGRGRIASENRIRSKPLRLGRLPMLTIGLAAAAVVAFGVFAFREANSPASHAIMRGQMTRHVPEQQVLPDGSRVEFKAGARIEVVFTDDERRVRLAEGDAHFTVVKDPSRPFVVTADDVAVLAVGTAFSVSRAGTTIEVLVSEGRVRVADVRGRSLLAADSAALTTVAPLESLVPIEPMLSVGQRVVISVEDGAPAPALIGAVTADELARVLAWRNTWLEFVELPLAKVVDEFNAYSAGRGGRRMRLADDATARVLVSGTFRADGVDAFVRLLGSSFDVNAATEANGTLVLRKTP